MQSIQWYVKRLARMSSTEMAYRVLEQAKRACDARTSFGWTRFGHFDRPIMGLRGLKFFERETQGGQPISLPGVEDIEAGHFHLLGRTWPRPLPNRPWWEQDFWHLDPVSGIRWPATGTFAFRTPYRQATEKGDVKYVWELNRLQFLPRLAAAKRFATVEAILHSWMAANPPYDGINWTSGIESASRLASLLLLLSYADDACRVRIDRPARAFLEAHARWIARYPSLHSSANNHRVAELAALFLVGLCAPGMPKAEQYAAEGRRGLEQEILHQFHADGVGAEQSPTYAAYSLEWFTMVGVEAEARGLPFSEAFRARAKAAVEYFRWISDDASCVPHIGDDDEGRVFEFGGKPKHYVAVVAGRAAAWLALPKGQQAGRRIFAEGGYTVWREPSPRGTQLLVFDHGPLGHLSIAAHGHADALSIWLHVGSQTVLTDAGTYLYHTGGTERDLFRSTAIHNTLTIEDENQSVIAGPFNWSRHARAQVIATDENCVTACHDGYVHRFGLRHIRSIVRKSENAFVIKDSLDGRPVRQNMIATIRYLVAPGLSVTRADENIIISCPAGPIATISIVYHQNSFDRPLAITKIGAPFSARFGEKSETPCLMVSLPVTELTKGRLVTRLHFL